MQHIVTLVCLFSALCTFAQEKTFLDFINDMTPIYPGCENAFDKSECYRLGVGELIRTELNKPENLTQLADLTGTLEIELSLRSEVNGDVTVLRNSGVTNNKCKEIVSMALAGLPPLQPISSFRDGEPKTSSTMFNVTVDRKSNSVPFELVHRKPTQDKSKIPSPNPDRIKNVVLKGCDGDGAGNDCFYTAIRDYVSLHIDDKISRQIIGQRVSIKIRFDKDGRFDSGAFSCTLKQHEDYFRGLLSTIKVLRPAQLNGESIDMTYSIPFRIL